MEILKYFLYTVGALIIIGFAYKLFQAAFWADATNGDRQPETYYWDEDE